MPLAFFFSLSSLLLLCIFPSLQGQMWTASMLFQKHFFWEAAPLHSITGKCQVGCQAPQNQRLLSRLWTILQQHSPRKKSILGGALMPISPPIAASTEHNACSSPLQQLFNNLNNQARPSTPQHGLRSHYFCTRPTYYSCFTITAALSTYTYNAEKGPFSGLCLALL